MVKDSEELSIIFVPLVLSEQTPMVEVFSAKKGAVLAHRAARSNAPACLFPLLPVFVQEVCPELRPRLCVIQRGSNGYGFNLHSERARPGQYIRAVDENSPAESAGLQPRDRIVEVGRARQELHPDIVVSSIVHSMSLITILSILYPMSIMWHNHYH